MDSETKKTVSSSLQTEMFLKNKKKENDKQFTTKSWKEKRKSWMKA